MRTVLCVPLDLVAYLLANVTLTWLQVVQVEHGQGRTDPLSDFLSDFTFLLLLFIIHCQSLKLNTKLTKTISFTERPPGDEMEGYCGAEKVEERLDKQYSDNKCMCCFCLEDPKSRLIWTFYHCRHKYLGYHPFWAFYKIQYLSLCFVLDNIYQGNLSLSRPHNIKKYHIVSLHLNLKRWILMDKMETFVWFIAF